jgi:outer membrane receptor protein involved in Fe transport
MSRRFASLLLALLVAAATPLIAHAQSATTGTIDGMVRGPDGDALPGVRVVVNGPALIQRDLTVYTDSTGYYRVLLLPPGTYQVQFALEGFRAEQRPGVIVRVGQTTELPAGMSLATVTTTEVVTGEAPIIDARAADLNFVYNAELVENIPTARNMNDVFSTVPGVETLGNLGSVQPGGFQVQNVLAAGERANAYAMDGADVTDPAASWNVQSFMPYDTIEEIQVVKAGKPAELPYQGGFLNTVTKSGGNDFSGDLGAYFTDNALQATNVDVGQGESTNEIVNGYELTASVGGRIVRDKLWWYGSVRRLEDTTRVFGFDNDIDNTVNAFSGKLTYQPTQAHRFTLIATNWSQEVNYFFYNFSPTLALDEFTAAVRPVDGATFGARWSGVLSTNVLAEAGFSLSRQGFDQNMQPGTSQPAIVDLVTGQRSRNLGEGTRDQDDDTYNLNGSLSWFVPDAAGRHDLKFGFEYRPTKASILFNDFQDHRLHSRFGQLFAVRFLTTPSLAVWNNDTTALFAQDTWALGERVTLNFGLRFMHTNASTPEQTVSGGTFAGTSVAQRFPALNATTLPAETLLNWNNTEPRFSVTVALDPSGRTVLRGAASRYHHLLSSFDLFVSNAAFPFNYVTLWFDRNGDQVFQPGEDGPLLFSFGGQINPVDPDIVRPYTNEFLVGVSHEINSDVQVSANYIYRKDQDLFNTVDEGVPFGSYTPTQVVDPGPDGVVGTPDDGSLTVYAQDPATIGNSELVLTNPPGDERWYNGLELTASKRFTNNWQAVASLVVSEMEVLKPTTALQTAGLYDTPNGLINAKGLDPANTTVQLKLQGTYQFRFGLLVSGFYRYLTGNPYTRELVVQGLPQGPFTVRAEPRGDSKTDSQGILDLRLEQTFQVGRAGSRIGVMIDVFNLFNAAPVLDAGRVTGVDYGQPRTYARPRIARLGLRYTF